MSDEGQAPGRGESVSKKLNGAPSAVSSRMLSGAGFQALLRLVLLLILARLIGPEAFGIVGAARGRAHRSGLFQPGHRLGDRATLRARGSPPPLGVSRSRCCAARRSRCWSGCWRRRSRGSSPSTLTEVLRVLGLVPFVANLGVVAEGLLPPAWIFASWRSSR
jgi:hypothetical protein